MTTTMPMPAKSKPELVPQSTSERQVLADAAKRILVEDVFVRARDSLRAHYLDQLAKCDPNNVNLIVQYQATIRAIDGINAELGKFAAGGSARAAPKVV